MMLFTLLPASLLTAAPAAGPLRCHRLRCESLVDPLGLATTSPRLTWAVAGAGHNRVQTAWQIEVASSRERLEAGEADRWDSGRVAGAATVDVAYGGELLAARDRCWWRVRAWDEHDQAGPWSEPARFSIGLLEPTDWAAKWIAAAAEPLPADAGYQPFRTSYWIWPAEPAAASEPVGFLATVPALPAGARQVTLNLAVNSAWRVELDGVEVAAGDGSGGRWRDPARLDLTGKLRGGETLAVAAANAGGPQGLLLELTVDDEPRLASSPEAFRAAGQPAAGWTAPGFDASDWPAAANRNKYGREPWLSLRDCLYLPPASEFRTTAVLPEQLVAATVYVTALGLYDLRLNGQPVTADRLRPGWTDYHQRIPYQTYEVADLLQPGENRIEATVAGGWYSGYVGLAGSEVYGRYPAFLMQLEAVDAAGATTVVTSGPGWEAGTGPVREGDLLQGETHDARQQPLAEDARLAVVLEQAPVAGRLQPHLGVPVRVVEELEPVAVSEPQPGVFVYDLGQNMVGWARLKVVGASPGQTVTLRFAEMLNPDGTLYTTNLRNARAVDRYVAAGEPEEVWEPRFTFHGFRYVEVCGYPGRPDESAVTGVVAMSATAPTGDFACDQAMVNQLQHNIVWGQMGNFLEVPTDCPQRDERCGWTGDAQVFAPTAAFNMDVAAFFSKWLQDLEDAQEPGGAFTDIAPRVAVGAGTAAWADAGLICPWSIYLAYADRDLLARHYPAMQRFITWLQAHSTDLIRPAAGYGDWLSINAETPREVIATAYFARSAWLCGQIAGVLGRAAEAAEYEALFQAVAAAFRQAFCRPDGSIHGETQTCYVLALAFDLLDDPVAQQQAVERLLADLAARDGHLSTGFVGTGLLLPTLSKYGQHKAAYRLLLKETFPSWGYSIRHGATTIWERWDGWTAEKGFQDPGMNSFNHYAFGAVGEWLYTTVAGLRPDPAAPGYEHILIAPQPGCGLTWARASLETVRGPVTVAWRKTDDGFELEFELPANTTATVTLPVAAEQAVWSSAPTRHLGGPTWQVGSGRYTVKA